MNITNRLYFFVPNFTNISKINELNQTKQQPKKSETKKGLWKRLLYQTLSDTVRSSFLQYFQQYNYNNASDFTDIFKQPMSWTNSWCKKVRFFIYEYQDIIEIYKYQKQMS